MAKTSKHQDPPSRWSRRTFLKVSGLAGVTAAAYAGGVAAIGDGNMVLKGLKESRGAVLPATEEQIFRSACNPECNNCALQVHVRNGRVVKLSPDPDFYTRPCLRGYSRLQWTYHPDRLKYPMKRVGARGEGKWERISWDEALNQVADGLTKIRDQYGPESVYFMGGAVMSALPGQIGGRFANAYGKGVTTGTLGQLCCAAQDEAEQATVGYRFAETEALPFSKLFISWGHNPVVTYLPHWRRVAQALENGARLITIDPRFSETASKSDLWLAPLPGTDAALSLGMINVVIAEKLYDEAYVLAKTNLPFLVNEKTGKLVREADIAPGGDNKAFLMWDREAGKALRAAEAKSPALEGSFQIGEIPVRTVFSRLKERSARFTPQRVEEITGVGAEHVVSVAREYANTKPAMFLSGMSGAQRTSFGEYFVASMITLAALTGNFGIRGGGLNDTGGYGSGILNSISAPFKANAKGSIPATKVGEYLLEEKPYPIKAVYWRGGSAGQWPNSNKVRKALLEKMELVVVQAPFMTDAAEVADIVLPVAHIFERYDLIAYTRSFYYELMDKAIEPLWESKSDTWIYSELAKRMGFGDLFDKSEEEWIDELLKPTALTTTQLREKGPVWIWSDPKYNRWKTKWDKSPHWFFKDTPFQTPSGRIEIHSTRWEDKKAEPMIDYFPPDESAETKPELVKKYPLSLVAAKIKTKVHSTFTLMPWLAEIVPEAWVDINTEDAQSRGIGDGQTVEVFNDRGSVKVKARVHGGIRPGVVSLQNGWWLQQGMNASVLSNDAFSAINYGHTLNSSAVEVRRV